MKILTPKQFTESWYQDMLDEKQVQSIYLQAWYLDVVCPNWQLVELKKDEVYAVLPIRKKLGLNYIFEPNFIQYFQFIGELSAELFQEFLEFLHRNFLHIRHNVGFDVLPQGGRFSRVECRNYILNLKGIEAFELSKNYSQNTRRNIKKAEKKGVKVFETGDFSSAISLFKSDKVEQLNLPVDYLEDALSLFQAAAAKGAIRVFEGKLADELLCSVVFLVHKGVATFIFSGNTKQAKEIGAFPFLINSAIISLMDAIKIIDFEGSNHGGLARFYQSFGAREEVYLRLVKKILHKPWKSRY